MQEYELAKKDIFNAVTTTKGTQPKYCKDDYYYKQNKNGNEGFVEYLVSRLLTYSTLKPTEYVMYEYCKINGKLGCRSYNFLSYNEVFITFNTIHRQVYGKFNSADSIWASGRDAKDRLAYILNTVDLFTGHSLDFRNYLNKVVQLDLLISNVDRHIHNFGIIINAETGEVRSAPIFDNGLSLETDGNSSVAACTFSGSFIEQVTAFSFPVKPAFKLDFVGIEKELKDIEDLYGRHKEINVLKNNMDKYGSMFM